VSTGCARGDSPSPDRLRDRPLPASGARGSSASPTGDEMTGTASNTLQGSALQDRLSREITGDVLFDSFSRGRYATDASFYQIVPAGVVVPRTVDEALRALAITRDAGRKG